MKLLVLALALLITQYAHSKSCGIITAKIGEVHTQPSKSKSFSKAKMGQKVCSGFTIRTKNKSRVHIRMLDKNEFHISENSLFTIENYIYKKQKKEVTLDLVYGSLRSAIKEKYDDKRNRFRVKTKTAVVGIRGTDFLTQFDRDSQESSVTTFSGQVDVWGVDDSGQRSKEPIRVKAGFSVNATKTSGLKPATRVPSKRLNELNRSTSIGGKTSNNSSIDRNRRKNQPHQRSNVNRENETSPRQRFENFGNRSRESGKQKARQNQQNTLREQQLNRPPIDQQQPRQSPPPPPPGDSQPPKPPEDGSKPPPPPPPNN